MTIWKKICKITDVLVNAGLVLACISIVGMAFIIVLEVVMRSFFTQSTLIADEFAGYFCASLTFFGAAYAVKKGAFIQVDILYKNFKGIPRKIADLFITGSSLIFCCALLYFITLTIQQSFQWKATSIFISKTLLFIPQSSMAVGGGLLVLQITVMLINQFIGEEGKK
jgi:TRAP-type C4-dicarboxylate transport system permease small subunit